MEDLSLLCAFIYRMPKLPSVDSVSRQRPGSLVSDGTSCLL